MLYGYTVGVGRRSKSALVARGRGRRGLAMCHVNIIYIIYFIIYVYVYDMCVYISTTEPGQGRSIIVSHLLNTAQVQVKKIYIAYIHIQYIYTYTQTVLVSLVNYII